MPTLDLTADVVTLTQQLCDIESVSHDEAAIADAIEAALRPLRHLEVVRRGNTVIARTDFGRDERVVLAGHIDTVPLTSKQWGICLASPVAFIVCYEIGKLVVRRRAR